MARTRVTPIGGEPNRATRVLGELDGPRIGVDELESVFEHAVAHAQRHRWAFSGIDGYRLYWARPGQPPSMRDLPDLPAAVAVVGRHAACDPHLDEDREISLRHLLVRPGRLGDGTLALRFLDLRAELPFHLLDDTPRRSIAAAGTVALRLGRYAIVALPFHDGRLGAAELAPPVIHEDICPPPSLTTSPSVTTNITILPEVTGVLDVADRRAPGDATLTVTRDGIGASVGVARQDLDRGVLIGRLPRCLDGGIRSILSAQISRAHLLVLAEGDRVTAFDLASTNGTFVRSRPVSCVRLRDQGTEVRLSRTGGVFVRYRREPLLS